MTKLDRPSRRCRRRPRALIVALALPALARRGAARAKTLVYCSEGSPENFYPGVNTTGTSFDANSQIYSRIVDFERGGTTVVPGLAEKLGHLADGKVYTFHLRKGVKWHNHRAWKPTRDFNADDMIFAIERQWKEDQPVLQGHELEPLVLQRHGHAEADQVGGEGRRLHGPDHAREARGAVPVEPGDGVRRRAVEGIRGRDAEGRHAREDRPGADRHRARSTSCSTRRTRSSATRRSRNTGAARRRSTTSSSRSRRTPRCAGPSCRRANAT